MRSENVKYPNFETNNIEFKLTIINQKKISWLKKVCGMVNEISGGILVIGVADNRDIIGVENVDETIDLFRKEVRDCISPIVPFDITIEEYDSKNVVVIDIKPGTQTPYILKESNGRHIVYVMRGNTTEPANQNDLVNLALRATNLSWDSLESDYTMDQLTFKELDRKHKETLGKSLITKDLSELGLINGSKVTNLGVLLSDQNSNTDSWISVTRWPGINKTASTGVIDKEFKGSIIGQIDEAYNFIISVIRNEFSFKEDSPQRKSNYEYDLLSLREAMVNAVVHRDYSVHNNQQIEVGIYDDRIEIKSTGSLFNGHTIEDLIKFKTIGRRNKALCNLMRELGYIESRGRGMEKIINPEEPWIRKPEFENSYNFFMITLYSNFYNKENRLLEGYLELLDQTDFQILDVLKDNPSITQRVLAKNLEISKRTVTTRLNKLVELNLLRKEGTPQKMRYLVLIDL